MGKLERTAFLAILASVGAYGCSDSGHPQSLHFDGGGGGGGVIGGGGSAGEGGDASTCNPNPTAGVRFGGDMVVRNLAFKDFVGFAGKAELVVEGTPCGWAKATYDGTAPQPTDGGKNRFLLEGVKTKTVAYCHDYQAEGSTQAVYPTVLPIPASATVLDFDSQVGFYSVAEIDKVYSDTQTKRDPDKGTLIVRLTTGFGNSPAIGASLAAPTGVIAYQVGSTWQLGGSTDETGVAIVLNADGKPFPGISVSVEVIENGQKEVLPVEQGAVTLGLIFIEFWAP